MMIVVFVFKQKTAYEMRMCDWSTDVCSSSCLPRVTQGLEPPLPGQRRLWPLFIRIGKHRPDFFCRLTERPACFRHDKLPAIARPAFVAVVCSTPLLVVEAESEIGRAHVSTPVTNAHHVSCILL